MLKRTNTQNVINLAATTALVLATLASTANAAEPTLSEARETLSEAAEAARLKQANKSFEEFKAGVFREPGPNGKFIVNGDTSIANEKLLKEYFFQQVKVKPKQPSAEQPELIVHTVGGLDAVWSSSEKRNLTYCISNSFGHRYGEAVAAFADATRAWEAVANIDFQHLASQDSGCDANNPNVVFDVRPVSGGNYLARAFFPNEGRRSRNVLIDSTSFDLDPNRNLSLTGILRHELGHTLGFRHEHTRPDSGTCFEDNNFRPLTSYDAFSTMHYPQCNGQGDWSLKLTTLDKNGAACLYGPAVGFTIDPSVCQSSQPGASNTKTVNFENIPVAQSEEWRPDTLFPVKPGTVFTARMEGAGIHPGDPDVYVKFGGLANQADFDCRPYDVGAEETCVLDVPAGASAASIMVRGYEAGMFSLAVTYTAP